MSIELVSIALFITLVFTKQNKKYFANTKKNDLIMSYRIVAISSITNGLELMVAFFVASIAIFK